MEELQTDHRGAFSFAVVDASTRDGVKRLQELRPGAGRQIPVPGVVVDGAIVFDRIPDMDEFGEWLDAATSHSPNSSMSGMRSNTMAPSTTTPGTGICRPAPGLNSWSRLTPSRVEASTTANEKAPRWSVCSSSIALTARLQSTHDGPLEIRSICGAPAPLSRGPGPVSRGPGPVSLSLIHISEPTRPY